MKKSAKIKLIISAIIIILVIILSMIININSISLKNFKQNKEKDKENVQNQYNVINDNLENEDESILYTDTSIQNVQSTLMLLCSQDGVNTYLNYIYNNNSAGLMGILNSEFIKSKNIDTNNVISNLKNTDSSLGFFATNVYSKEISYSAEYKFWVYGKLYTKDYKKYSEELFIVNMDFINYTFKIIPEGEFTEEEFSKYIKLKMSEDVGGVKVPDSEITSIASNNYNKFIKYDGNDRIKKTIENYAKYYYFMQVTNPQTAYNLLDDEYKSARFGNINNYLKSAVMWKNIDIQYVKQTIENNKNQYIGIDKKGNYYIFNEYSPMNYKVILDSYTLPLAETVKKYNSSSEIEKACMCVKMLEEMINNKDFTTMYNHMNLTFKENNYSTKQSFEDYITQNYYNNVKFNLKSYKESEGSYIININIVNLNSEDESESLEARYVVKLGNSVNDFEFSFL